MGRQKPSSEINPARGSRSRATGRTDFPSAKRLCWVFGRSGREHELIRTRAGEWRERAKARGVILGRKAKLTGHQRREAIGRREAGKVLRIWLDRVHDQPVELISADRRMQHGAAG